MSRLTENIEIARALLTEQAVGKDPLLACADEWRVFCRQGDEFLGAIEQVVEASVRASEAEDPLSARRANVDVSRALSHVIQTTSQAYRHFATGRQNLYEFARLYDIETKRSSQGKTPEELKLKTDQELRKAVEAGARGLQKGVREMLDLGTRAHRAFRQGAQLMVKADQDLPLDLAKMVVENGLDFRDAVGANVFARTNGVMRRAALLSRRAWELMMMEGERDGWTAPWSQDPEFGGLELL